MAKSENRLPQQPPQTHTYHGLTQVVVGWIWGSVNTYRVLRTRVVLKRVLVECLVNRRLQGQYCSLVNVLTLYGKSGVHEARGELNQWPDCIRLPMVKQSRNAQWHMSKGCFSRKGTRPPLLPSLLIAVGAAVVRHHQVRDARTHQPTFEMHAADEVVARLYWSWWTPKNRGSTDPMDDGDNNRPDDTNFSKKECDG
uniref:Uncharacterized protein n=1 Tax=Tanacetum cinerariifolium TaxID=118510 RepID=A0A6L2P4B6_TANCI|nr:hypothetical protein [Tanacetum cinerariifolium]